MSTPGSDGVTATTSRESPEGAFLGLLNTAARVAVVVGVVGSLGLMFRSGRNTPKFLLVIFVFWVASPFVALGWANWVAKRWSVLTRATLSGVTLFVSLGSLAIYGELILPPAGSAHAFVFVAVPPASWLLMILAVPLAALISRRRIRANNGR